MLQQLHFASCDGVSNYRATECGARQRCRSFVDEKERDLVAIQQRCTAMDPWVFGSINPDLACRRGYYSQ
jgi:hypothetical protein